MAHCVFPDNQEPFEVLSIYIFLKKLSINGDHSLVYRSYMKDKSFTEKAVIALLGRMYVAHLYGLDATGEK